MTTPRSISISLPSKSRINQGSFAIVRRSLSAYQNSGGYHFFQGALSRSTACPHWSNGQAIPWPFRRVSSFCCISAKTATYRRFLKNGRRGCLLCRFEKQVSSANGFACRSAWGRRSHCCRPGQCGACPRRWAGCCRGWYSNIRLWPCCSSCCKWLNGLCRCPAGQSPWVRAHC